MQQQEMRREAQHARFTEVRISEKGIIELEVINPLVPVPKRELANFRDPKLVKIVSTDGDQGIYRLSFDLAGKKREVYLLEEKVGKSDYILQKIIAAGGQILVDKKSTKKTLVENLWICLIVNCNKTLVVPTHYGWSKYGNKFYFWEEGEEVWETIRLKAR